MMGKLYFIFQCFISVIAQYKSTQTVSATHRHGNTQREQIPENKGELCYALTQEALLPSGQPEGVGPWSTHKASRLSDVPSFCPHSQPLLTALLNKAKNYHLTVCIWPNEKKKKKKSRIFWKPRFTFCGQSSSSILWNLWRSFSFVYRGGNIFSVCMWISLCVGWY